MTTKKTMRLSLRFLIVSGIALISVLPATATVQTSYYTSVTNVLDGGTVVINNRTSFWGHELRINNVVPLDGIDAPSLEEQGGKEARDALAELVLGKRVNVREYLDTEISRGVSLYVSATPRTFREEDNINLMMVKKGMAKWGGDMITESISATTMAEAERKAREQRIGIWGKGATATTGAGNSEEVFSSPSKTTSELTNAVLRSSVPEMQMADEPPLSSPRVETPPHSSSAEFVIAVGVVAFVGFVLWVARKCKNHKTPED